jgi:hypothetical protein
MIEPGRFADIIAVAGDALHDVSELERVTMRDEGRASAPTGRRGSGRWNQACVKCVTRRQADIFDEV